MNLAMRIRADELIDVHGSLDAAIRNREATIERRSVQGKLSPAATAELDALRELPCGYATPTQKRAMEQYPFAGIR